MNERTLLGIDCNGAEIYGKLDKISVHANSHPNVDGSSSGWRESRRTIELSKRQVQKLIDELQSVLENILS